MQQRSPEWYAARCGLVTASKISAVLAGEQTKGHRDYVAQLVRERLTGEVIETPTTHAMQWGIDHEDQARATYELLTARSIKDVGFLRHPTIDAGASPDGLVDEDGLIEIKCPTEIKHMGNVLGYAIDREYCLQMAWQMACTGRAWCDFVSFDPRISTPSAQISIRRIDRDKEEIARIEAEVMAFNVKLDGYVAQFKSQEAA